MQSNDVFVGKPEFRGLFPIPINAAVEGKAPSALSGERNQTSQSMWNPRIHLK